MLTDRRLLSLACLCKSFWFSLLSRHDAVYAWVMYDLRQIFVLQNRPDLKVIVDLIYLIIFGFFVLEGRFTESRYESFLSVRLNAGFYRVYLNEFWGDWFKWKASKFHTIARNVEDMQQKEDTDSMIEYTINQNSVRCCNQMNDDEEERRMFSFQFTQSCKLNWYDKQKKRFKNAGMQTNQKSTVITLGKWGQKKHEMKVEAVLQKGFQMSRSLTYPWLHFLILLHIAVPRCLPADVLTWGDLLPEPYWTCLVDCVIEHPT